MTFLLDTNIISAFMRGDLGIRDRFIQSSPASLFLCAPVKAEILRGLELNPSLKRRHQVDGIFRQFQSIPFDDPAADECATIWAFLEAAGQPIGTFDLLIASVAKSKGMAVITRNTREFSRIPGLSTVQW